jgi:hypothetical protein
MAGNYRQYPLLAGLVFSAAIWEPIRLPIAVIAPSVGALQAGLRSCARMALGKLGNHSLHAPTRANIPTSRYGSGRLRDGTSETGERKRAQVDRALLNIGPDESCSEKG